VPYDVLAVVCGLLAFLGGTDMASRESHRGKFAEKFGMLLMIIGLLSLFTGIAFIILNIW